MAEHYSENWQSLGSGDRVARPQCSPFKQLFDREILSDFRQKLAITTRNRLSHFSPVEILEQKLLNGVCFHWSTCPLLLQIITL